MNLFKTKLLAGLLVPALALAAGVVSAGGEANASAALDLPS
jgi:hypothetical protein